MGSSVPVAGRLPCRVRVRSTSTFTRISSSNGRRDRRLSQHSSLTPSSLVTAAGCEPNEPAQMPRALIPQPPVAPLSPQTPMSWVHPRCLVYPCTTLARPRRHLAGRLCLSQACPQLPWTALDPSLSPWTSEATHRRCVLLLVCTLVKMDSTTPSRTRQSSCQCHAQPML